MNRTKVRVTDNEVTLAINEELEYQETMPASRANNEDYGLAGQLVSLERYTRKTLDAWADSNGDVAALDQLRKVAAIAIRALTLYGCPRRVRSLNG